MNAPCESIARYVLPVFRSFVAKELVEKYDLTQIEAAKKLGTTQAAISQYLHSKRGFGGDKNFKKTLPKIRELAQKTAKRIITENISPNEFMATFCDLCRELQASKILKT